MRGILVIWQLGLGCRGLVRRGRAPAVLQQADVVGLVGVEELVDVLGVAWEEGVVVVVVVVVVVEEVDAEAEAEAVVEVVAPRFFP